MATTPPFLTQIQLAAAQAEAEGYQNGPNPTLNSANLYTQDVLGNNQVVPVVVSPVPYYPDTDTTPNLQLSLKDLSAQLANNFVILDGAIPVIESFDFFAVAVPETFHFTPPCIGLVPNHVVYCC